MRSTGHRADRSLPGRLGDDRVDRGGVLRARRSPARRSATGASRNCLVGAPVSSQASGPRMRLHLVRVQPVGQLVLVDRADASRPPPGAPAPRRRRPPRPRPGCRRRTRLAYSATNSSLLRRLRLLVPADRVEDALGVRLADAVAVLAGVARRRGLEQHLRRVVQLLERADQADAVLEDGALGDQVGLLRRRSRWRSSGSWSRRPGTSSCSTVFTPSASSCFCIDSITGVVNGSSCVG